MRRSPWWDERGQIAVGVIGITNDSAIRQRLLCHPSGGVIGEAGGLIEWIGDGRQVAIAVIAKDNGARLGSAALDDTGQTAAGIIHITGRIETGQLYIRHLA